MEFSSFHSFFRNRGGFCDEQATFLENGRRSPLGERNLLNILPLVREGDPSPFLWPEHSLLIVPSPLYMPVSGGPLEEYPSSTVASVFHSLFRLGFACDGRISVDLHPQIYNFPFSFP